MEFQRALFCECSTSCIMASAALSQHWIGARRRFGSILRRSPVVWNSLARLDWQRANLGLRLMHGGRPEPRVWGDARRAVFDRWGGIPCSRSERLRTASLKNRYRGERIFLIGNAPSLNRLPLEKLKSEFTFGVNRIYLLFDRISWRPTFYTVLDWRVGPDIASDVNALDGMTFLLDWRYHGLLRGGPDTYWFSTGSKEFSYDATERLYGGGTVMVATLQLAYYMGFNPIYLIGVDASYTVPKTVIQTGEDRFGTGIKSELTSTRDDDPNHFDPRYFGAGRRWHDPNVQGMIEGFTTSRDALAEKGVKVYNATAGGALEVFERVAFDSLFD
jgi:hypothetical protein